MHDRTNASLAALPSFNAARRYGWPLLSAGVVSAVLGAVLVSLAVTRPGAWRPLGYLGAALWLLSAGFLSAALLSFARQRLLAAAGSTREPLPPVTHASTTATTPIAARRMAWLGALRKPASVWMAQIRDAEWLSRWPPALVALLFGLLALAAAAAAWRAPADGSDPTLLKLLASALIIAAFPLLVLQRQFATISAELLPEAPQLERLTRVPLTACLILAAAQILRSVGIEWAARVEGVAVILVFVVAFELLLRYATIVFVPFAPIERRQSLADSAIAGAILRLRVPNIRTIGVAVRRHVGFDLSRSWALAFIQKAALPVLAGLGLFAWVATGVTALGISERGIYERFGAPVAVFGPGLHFHLPWPLGAVRTVEIGVVHLLPIEFLLPGGDVNGKSSEVGNAEQEQLVGAEAPAPASADRLWTDDHPFEGSYIIASEEQGKQTFQLVDIDMAVLYRVGASDQAARDASYRVADIDELIQALSGQLLVRYFTSNTLLDLLGKSRESFAKEFQTALQAQLDRFGTGVEAVGVSVEAIHPPPGAANAYHNVQAAEIRANTDIATQRGEAARRLKTVEATAQTTRDQSVAAAAELVGQARSDSVVFAGDVQAHAQGGYPFLLERWFDDLSKGLGQADFIVVDHRLRDQNMPALDLRNLRGAAGTATAPAAFPDSPGRASEPAPIDDDDR